MFGKLKAAGRSPVRNLPRDKRGAIAVLVAFLVPVLVGVAGLSVDVGLAYAAKMKLREATQAAALFAASSMSTAPGSPDVPKWAVDEWRKSNPPTGIAISSTTTETYCDAVTAGLPSCDKSSPNVVRVTQKGSVSTHFLKALGKTSFDLSSTVAVARAGGETPRLNLMIVLDVTGSMWSEDPTCKIPGVTGPVAKLTCATYAIQKMLKSLPTSRVSVGLMVFPGLVSMWDMTTSCGTIPKYEPYFSPTIQYQVASAAFDAGYNDGMGNLVSTSPLVRAVGNFPSDAGCLSGLMSASAFNWSVPLGETIPSIGYEAGTYGAEVIEKAADALAAKSGPQKAIIFISDGILVTSYLNLLSGRTDKLYKQCAAASDAASSARTSGVAVYSIAWASPKSGCSSDKGVTPCLTMKNIATRGKFYTTSADCQESEYYRHPVGDLPTILAEFPMSITRPRLLSSY